MKLRKFEDHLHERLRETSYAAAYVETALEEGGVEEFLYALREVAIAQGGIQKVAADSRLGRESLYKSLSKQGNPRLKTVDSVLRSLGLRIAIATDETARDQKPTEATLASA